MRRLKLGRNFNLFFLEAKLLKILLLVALIRFNDRDYVLRRVNSSQLKAVFMTEKSPLKIHRLIYDQTNPSRGWQCTESISQMSETNSAIWKDIGIVFQTTYTFRETLKSRTRRIDWRKNTLAGEQRTLLESRILYLFSRAKAS